MSGASAHKSRTQRQARRLAADLAKGRMPASTVDLEDYLDRFPDDVFVALDGFVEQVASSGADDAIALGYLYLIQGQLERVRFRSERGYEDATRLIEEFQRAVADLAVTGRIDAQALSMVTSVLHMAGIEASAELHAGVTQFAENVLPLAAPPDFTDAMADMVAECEGDPFQLAGALAEAGHAIPAEARILMAIEQIRSTNAALREAAILCLLDGEPTLRRAVASELQASQAPGCKPFAGVPAPADRDAQLVPGEGASGCRCDHPRRTREGHRLRGVAARRSWDDPCVRHRRFWGAGLPHRFVSGAEGADLLSSTQERRPRCLVGAAGVQTRSPIDARTGRDGDIDEAGIAQIF